jgi:molybdopterin/thiamine biosynthesis adenylyltransferase/rhodanese-related sulfurtransferase
MLSDTDKHQFSRQMRLPGFGEEKQLLLKSAHVMVVGLGGLGCPVAQYVASAGIGKLTLIDYDRIELHNIHRQPLFGTHDVGQYKAEKAALKLKDLYPTLDIDFITRRFDGENSGDIQMIADCTDNFNARYSIDAFACERKIPVLFGAMHQHEGRLSLFHGRTGTRYTDAYPRAPISELIQDCETEGVHGPLAGIIGSMMASAILEFITTGKSVLDGAMMNFDSSTLKTHLFEIQRQFPSTHNAAITSLNASLANAPLLQSVSYELIDVREWYEHDEFNIGGKCCPAAQVREWENQLDPKKTSLLYCNHGHQSFLLAQYISARLPHMKIAHLNGGLDAWRELVDAKE